MEEFMNAVKEKATEVIDQIRTKPVEEGRLTKMVENQTAKIPSMAFLTLAIGTIAASAAMKLIRGRKSTTPNFVGLWVPTFLLLGIYNKLVKIEGNDRYNRT